MNSKLIPRFYYSLPFFLYFNFSGNNSSKFIVNKTYLNSARTSLRLLLSSIAKSPLKVGVQAYTCLTVFQSILKAGCTPVFIDITNDFKMDLNDLKIKINNIDILIVTHTFGFPEDFDKIKEIVKDKIIIEDCAHSFLSTYKSKYTGILGDAAIFSTGFGKFPAIGAGGFCVINNTVKFPYFRYEYNKLKPISVLQAFVKFIKTIIFSIFTKPPFYGTITFKLGKKLDSKLDFIDKFNFKESLSMKWVENVFSTNYMRYQNILVKQSSNAKYLVSLLRNKNFIAANSLDMSPNFYVFPILVKKRDQLFDELLDANIESGKHFSKSLSWANEFGYKKGDCPQTEEIINHVITLPVHYGVSRNTIKKIAEIVNKYE